MVAGAADEDDLGVIRRGGLGQTRPDGTVQRRAGQGLSCPRTGVLDEQPTTGALGRPGHDLAVPAGDQ